MCILFLELYDSPSPDGFRLVLASNRDEQYRRPTDHAHLWEEAPSVMGGRDREPGRSGGTWLAMNTAGAGRVAALLNVMGTQSLPDSLPRGALVADFVRSQQTAAEYMDALVERGPTYSAFHLVTIDLSPSSGGLWHYSNCSVEDGEPGGVLHRRSGRLSLGNSVLSQPFRKVTAGGQRFDAILERHGRRQHRDQLVEELLGLLKWEQKHYPDETLDARAMKANVERGRVPMLSAVCQRLPTYGTRTHTIILVDADWNCDFFEWTLGEDQESPVIPEKSGWKHTHKTFKLKPNGE